MNNGGLEMFRMRDWLQKSLGAKGFAVAAALVAVAVAVAAVPLPASAQTASWVCGADSSGLSGNYWAWAHAPASLIAATEKAKAPSAALVVGRRVKLQLAKQQDIALAQKKPGAQGETYAGTPCCMSAKVAHTALPPMKPPTSTWWAVSFPASRS